MPGDTRSPALRITMASVVDTCVAVGASAGVSPLSSAGTALALVQGLHPSDRDGAAFLDEVRAQVLGIGHLIGPRIIVFEESQRRVDGEVGRYDVIELVPLHREGHGHARSNSRAVGRNHRGAADSRRVDEYLAATV